MSIANYFDTVIDYPMSRAYVEQLCQRFKELEVLSEQRVEEYKAHLENVEKQSSEIGMD